MKQIRGSLSGQSTHLVKGWEFDQFYIVNSRILSSFENKGSRFSPQTIKLTEDLMLIFSTQKSIVLVTVSRCSLYQWIGQEVVILNQRKNNLDEAISSVLKHWKNVAKKGIDFSQKSHLINFLHAQKKQGLWYWRKYMLVSNMY